MSEIRNINIGVCEGRHPLPVEHYLFPQVIEDVTDTAALRQQSITSLKNIMSKEGIEMESMHLDSLGGDYQGYAYPCVVNIYATGLTVAVLAALETVVHYCYQYYVWHYDAKNNTYYKQRLFF